MITGAAGNAPVTMKAWQNGVPLNGGNPWAAGKTFPNGSFTLTGTETANSISEYVEKWFVNGTQIGQDLEFAVIDKPISLSVASASLADWPNGCTAGGYFWGITIDVKYNILASTAQNVATTYINMIPHEDGNILGPGGVVIKHYSNNVGGPGTQYANSATYAGDDGTFHDVPVSTCANGAFSNAGATQNLAIQIGNSMYPVRENQRWTTASSSSGHGSITNSIDVSLTR